MRDRNVEIDRLRAIAILITIYGHGSLLALGQVPWFDASITHVDQLSGVVLFFAISGSVISQGVIPLVDNAARKSKALLSFWTRRITRITPMAALWVLLPLALIYCFNASGMLGTRADNDPAVLPALFYYFDIYAAFHENRSIFALYWTLSVEEQFYLCFPLMLLLLKTRRSRIAALCLIELAWIFLPRRWTYYWIDPIVFGCLLSLMVGRWSPNRPPVSKLLGMAATVALVGTLVALVPLAYRFYIYDHHVIILECLPVLTAVLAIALVALANRRQGFILPVGARLNAVLDWIGTRSYGLYLIHIPVFLMASEITFRMQRFTTPVGRTCIAIPLLIVVTELCYRLFEMPIRAFGRKLASSIEDVNQRIAPAQTAGTHG